MTKQEIARSIDNILCLGGYPDLMVVLLKDLRMKVDADAKAEREEVTVAKVREILAVDLSALLLITPTPKAWTAIDPRQIHVEYA